MPGITSLINTLSKDEARKLLESELEKFFGKTEISGVLPSTFFGATISADPQTEAARPLAADAAREFSNFRICGDWVQTGLPCTMESAAKSAADLSL
ncbi:MAG: FAD-dependent oxidoreductase [Opitutales bacterium]|nr:FAD-dependent oxidoreductase [Opitutales bacterium]